MTATIEGKKIEVVIESILRVLYLLRAPPIMDRIPPTDHQIETWCALRLEMGNDELLIHSTPDDREFVGKINHVIPRYRQ